jgi:hypothetical protein
MGNKKAKVLPEPVMKAINIIVVQDRILSYFLHFVQAFDAKFKSILLEW